jgi:acetyl/propionyl-CoA carboxylase alpha subunit
MFKKILVANHDGVATRVVRTCREMGIQSLVVFNDCDSGSSYVRMADECVRCESQADTQDSQEILFLARQKAADAIYPDNGSGLICPDFINACQQSGITFIGPSVELTEAVRCKEEVREIACEAGFPVVDEHTVPVHRVGTFLLGDSYGHMKHFGERQIVFSHNDQVLIEESPAACLSAEQRRMINETAVRIGKVLRFQSIGVVEFFLDEDGRFYFSELKPLAPQEYPLAELNTGIDLVEQQIRIVQGDQLSAEIEYMRPKGWAMLSRVISEQDGDLVSTITAWGETRSICLKRLCGELEEYKPGRLDTNLSGLQSIMGIPEVLDGTYSAMTAFYPVIQDKDCTERLRDLAVTVSILYALRSREVQPTTPARLNTKWVRNSRKLRAWEYGGINYEQADRDD